MRGESLIQPVSFLMFNRDSEPMPSHAGFRKGISSRATVKRTTELAGFTMPDVLPGFQGRTLTSTWGESVESGLRGSISIGA